MLGGELVRLQCYEGIDSTQALYDWDFPRQLLHLRAAEASGITDPAATEASLYDRRFLLARPILRALESSTPEHRSVLLIDEIDRADDEFEAFLLEVLSDYAVTIPELGTVRAQTPPLVIVTSNRTRDVHDALKRRCLYHWLDHPARAREVAILRRRVPDLSPRLAEQVAYGAARLRGLGLVKPPGLAESLDWARSLQVLGAGEVTAETAAASLGAVVKYREDVETSPPTACSTSSRSERADRPGAVGGVAGRLRPGPAPGRRGGARGPAARHGRGAHPPAGATRPGSTGPAG